MDCGNIRDCPQTHCAYETIDGRAIFVDAFWKRVCADPSRQQRGLVTRPDTLPLSCAFSSTSCYARSAPISSGSQS